MLIRHSDFQGTLILTPDGRGGWDAKGKPTVRLGYSVADTGAESEEGVWGRWNWDGTVLTVQNDRFGFLPIYYAPIANGFGVSTSAIELINAGASRQFDDAAIAVFLRLGHYIGNDTPFREIRVLPPGTILTWQNAQLSLKATAPALPRTVSMLSREQAVREYGVRFQDVVERMTPEEPARHCVPLSAGRDSRHILYALVRAGRRPEKIVTVRSPPPRPSTDAETAAKIAAALNLPHTILDQSADRFADEMEKDLLTSFCADEHAQMVPVTRWLDQQCFDVSWDGIAGDIFSCGVYNDSCLLDQFRDGKFCELAEWMLSDEGYLPRSVAPDYLKRWNRELAIAHLSGELAQYADLPNPAAPFFFFNRVRRELALCPFGMLNQKTHILAPYLSHEIFDLLINLPFEFFRGRQFHSEAIDQFYPELPRFEYVSTPTGTVRERRSNIWRFASRLGTLACSAGDHSCIQRKFLLPRLAKAMLHRSYGTETPLLFSRLLVMLHLEQVIQQQGLGWTSG